MRVPWLRFLWSHVFERVLAKQLIVLLDVVSTENSLQLVSRLKRQVLVLHIALLTFRGV